MTRHARLAAKLAGVMAVATALTGCADASVGASAAPTATTPVTATDAASVARASDSWTRTARSPLPIRVNSTTVWTGTEVLVFGGSKPAGIATAGGGSAGAQKLPSEPLLDGAAYDPSRDTWRPIARMPQHLTGSTAIVDGTVYLLTSSSQHLWAYSVQKDRWRRLADPASQAHRYLDGIVAVPGGLFTWSNMTPTELSSADQLYDARTDTWRPAPRNPRAVGENRRVTSTPEGRVVSVGIPHDPDWRKRRVGPRPHMRASVLGPGAKTWRMVDPGNVLLDSYINGWGAADGLVVRPSVETLSTKQAGARAERGPTGGMLDPVSGAWSALPPRPAATVRPRYGMTAWGGDWAILDGWALDVPRRQWHVLSSPVRDMAYYLFAGPALIADGSLFLAGGGTRRDGSKLEGWLWTPGTNPA